jgi:hypothetical protein
VFAATMQAVSGAGYPGVPSLDILGNVDPVHRRRGAEDRAELRKLLGGYVVDDARRPSRRSAPARTRTGSPVEHGHTVCLSVGFARRPSPADVVEALRAWRGRPRWPTRSRAARARPSRRSSCSTRPTARSRAATCTLGGGMSVVVGRVREDAVLDVRLVAMGHNTIRGAAGGSILNAELLCCGARAGAADPAALVARRVIVVKFGGTSVGDAAAIERAAEHRPRAHARAAARRGVGDGGRDQRAARASPSRRRAGTSSARCRRSRRCASGTSRPLAALVPDAAAAPR